ncbi:sulfotransferase family protein [Thalassotalea ganghwensis]
MTALNKNKIFIIGLPRTGTTSICEAMLKLGFSVAHTAYTQQTFNNAQVLADTPIFHDFELLDQYYPNSKFILLTRDLSLWLPSIKQLLNRMSKNLLCDDGGFNPHIKRCYLATFSPFTLDNINQDDFLINCYRKHFARTQHYFKNKKSQLLTIDISEDKSYQALCRFVDKEDPYGQFAHLNIGGKVTAWKDITHQAKISSTKNGKASDLAYLIKQV